MGQEEVMRLESENTNISAITDERNSYYNILSDLNLLIYDKDELTEQISKMKIIHEKAVGVHDDMDIRSEAMLKNRIDELANQEMQWKHQVTELEFELKEMHGNYKDEKALNDELNEKIRELEMSEINLRHQLARFEVNGSNLLDQNDELKERSADLEFSLKTARRSERDAKFKVQQLENRENEMVENFESIIDQYEAAETKLKGKLSDAADDKKKLLDTVDELTYRISELEYMETMLNQKIKHAENSESSLQSRLQRLESEENAGQLRVIELEKQKEAATKRIQLLEEDKNNLSSEISDLELAKNDYKGSLSMTDEYLKNKVESQSSIIQTYELRVSELLGKETLLETQIKEFISQEEELDKKIVELEKKNAELLIAKDSSSRHVQARISDSFTIKQVMPEFKQAMKDLEVQYPEAYIEFSKTLYNGYLSKEKERLFNDSLNVGKKHESEEDDCVFEETIEPVEKKRESLNIEGLTSEDPLWQAIETGTTPITAMSSEEKFWANIERRSASCDEMVISIPMHDEPSASLTALSKYKLKQRLDDDIDGACSADEASEINNDEEIVAFKSHVLSMTPDSPTNKGFMQLIEEEKQQNMGISMESIHDSGLETIDISYKQDLEEKVAFLERQLEIHKSASTLISKEELEDLENELASVKFENKRLGEEIENLEGAQQKAEALEAQVTELIEEIEQLHKTIQERSDQLDVIQNEYFELNQRCQELQAGEEEKDELEAKIVQLRNQLSETDQSQNLEKITSLEDWITEKTKQENELV